jgi:hypothetical protein
MARRRAHSQQVGQIHHATRRIMIAFGAVFVIAVAFWLVFTFFE